MPRASSCTLPELQDLFDEWLLAGWQARPHDALRDPLLPRRVLSPNEMYAALAAAAGYLPLALSGEDYLELLPVAWRQINAYGIRMGHRTYDCAQLGPWRLQHSGVMAKRGLWEVHYDPYDLSHVFVRTPRGVGHGAVDSPADGLRAVRRVHLAACPAAGRRKGPG
jgi:putative transposase